MTYPEFHNKMMELNKREQDLRSSHETQNTILAEQHKNAVRVEQDRYEDAVRKEKRTYLDKQNTIREEKSHLRFLWAQTCHNRGEQPYVTIDEGVLTNKKHQEE